MRQGLALFGFLVAFFFVGSQAAQTAEIGFEIDKPITVCTMEYAPVCGVIKKCNNEGCVEVKKTFSNPCMARSAGAKIISGGDCADSSVRPPIHISPISPPETGGAVLPGSPPKPLPMPKPIPAPIPIPPYTKPPKPQPPVEIDPKPIESYPGAQHCPRVYEPVCVISESSYTKMCKKENECSIYKYLPNKCVAQALGLTIVDNSECVDNLGRLPGKPDRRYWDGSSGSDYEIPPNCMVYYDGCNNCTVTWKDGKPFLVRCTLRYCIQSDKPKCVKYATSSATTTKPQNLVPQQTKNLLNEQVRANLVQKLQTMFPGEFEMEVKQNRYENRNSQPQPDDEDIQDSLQEQSPSEEIIANIEIEPLQVTPEAQVVIIKKPAKLFGFIPITLNLKAEINPSNQEVEIKKPWWSILVW